MKRTAIFTYIATAGLLLLLVVVAGFVVGKVFSDDSERNSQTAIDSFEECAEAGNPIMESYPPQCRTEDGRTFTQDIGNILEKTDLVTVDSPRPNAEVGNTFTVEGSARGMWYFEADFPVTVLSASGERIGESYAMAEGEWMTEDFVPFRAEVTVEEGYTGEATLVLKKANASGLPEHDDSVRFPIEITEGDEPISSGGCYVGGCSGQICSDDPNAVSTCEWRAEYTCYDGATCERQASGECGWTETAVLLACLEGANTSSAL